MRRFLAFFILGFLAGSITLNLYLGNRIDTIYWEKEELRVRLFENNQRLKNLESQLESHRNPLINEVIIELETEKNSFVEINLREEINRITGDLVGEEIDDISPRLIRRLIDGRQIHLEDKSTYELELNWIILHEKTVINTTAHYLDDSTVE